jgi:formamidopyrimidine-DNA glycosylase
MPELPEVETIRNKFSQGTEDTPSLIGGQITGVEVLWKRTLAEPSGDEFEARAVGQSITQIGRRGKYLLFQLQRDTLIIHLRMSGDLWLEASDAPMAPHHRLLLYLKKAGQTYRLAFNDTRKFGRAWLVNNPETILAHLGPEPLDDDFTAQVLYDRLHDRRRQLKPLLLNQRFIAGVGNIYADEALHRAKLHPLIRSHTLSFEQTSELWESLRLVLREGIKRNGASIDWVYRGGDFQNQFQVYQRSGEPCFNCNTRIERITVGQRSTHFCPQCQRPPKN